MVDVGAHVGVHALTAARRLRDLGGGGRVIAFEPTEDSAAAVRAAAARNDLPVDVVRAALGEEEGTIELRGDPRYGTFDAGVRSQFGDGEVVATAPLTHLRRLGAARAALDRLDLVKIDIEGAEILALRGMRETLRRLRPRVLAIEVKDVVMARGPGDEAALHALLADCGYVSTASPSATSRSSARRRSAVSAASRAVAHARRDESLAHDVGGEPRQLAQFAQPGGRAAGGARPDVRRERPSRPTYRHDGRGTVAVRSASVTPIDENASWTSIRPPSGTRAPQRTRSARAGPKRCAPSTNSRSTGPSNARQRHGREVAEMAHPVRTPARSRLRRNAAEVLLAQRGLRRDLPRPAVRAGVRVDAHDLDVRPRPAGEDDRRPTAERADLHDPPAGRHRAAAANSRRACASVSQPSTSHAASHAAAKLMSPRRPAHAARGARARAPTPPPRTGPRTRSRRSP